MVRKGGGGEKGRKRVSKQEKEIEIERETGRNT
jgi:hypothetical protein